MDLKGKYVVYHYKLLYLYIIICFAVRDVFAYKRRLYLAIFPT